MRRPLLLDLFCGAGGASMGYYHAGFDVIGVDIKPQPHYPFRFVQGDALSPPVRLEAFDLIHASPPCQRYTVAGNIHGKAHHPDLVPPTQELLRAWGGIYVVENVPGAPLLGPVTVCGLALGCNVKRHRLFESNLPLLSTTCPKGHPGEWVLVFGHTVLERSHQIDRNTPSGDPRFRRRHLGTDMGREAMGIDWMNRDELSEAVPPAYTEWIGQQILQKTRL